jgi:two-component system, NarL family, response regulator NreC
MKAPKKASVLLADEQTLFMESLTRVCEETQRYHVVGHCRDGRSAVRMIRSVKPDIAVLDLGLPKMYALAVAQEVRQSGFAPKIVILSMRRDRKSVLESLRTGANAYVLKSDPVSCLLDALHEVLGGSIYVSPQFKLGDIFSTDGNAPSQKPYEQLSAREHQVFTLLVQGLRSKEIADQLDLSPKTVNTYRSNLMSKLNIHDLPGLVKFAIRKKLIPLS